MAVDWPLGIFHGLLVNPAVSAAPRNGCVYVNLINSLVQPTDLCVLSTHHIL